MRRVVLETLAAYAALAGAELLALKAAAALAGPLSIDAGFWGGLLIFDVFAAAVLAGALQMRRGGLDGTRWTLAALAVGGALALGLFCAANAVMSVALLLPGDSLGSAALATFLIASFAARMSFWAAAQGLEAFQDAESEEA